uniref:RING-type domain-containing protein n=1 Tax=Strongyloides venezuelensis TaxID=75913 RepID=A0A0K0FVX7_STRVS
MNCFYFIISFVCVICSDFYTGNGTEHVLYSTKCGHLIGKSCLEKWTRRNTNQSEFYSPLCRELLLGSDCHPIYDIPEEVGLYFILVIKNEILLLSRK